MEEKFLGRPIFDSNTRTWRFADGSGVVPYELYVEMKLELDTGNGAFLRAWFKRLRWGDRLKNATL